MLVKPFDFVTWDGIVKKLISWWRDSPDGLNVEQPTEVANDNPSAFQSLVNGISQGIG